MCCCPSLAAGRLLGLLAVFWGTSTLAQDTVYVSNPNSPQGFTKVTGRIVDYTSDGLKMELAGAVPRTYPAAQVQRIETNHSREQLEADRRLAAGEFQSALALYEKARSDESRAWVRREITAQMVWCYQGLDRWVQAGEEFLVLVRSDPATIHFNCIPLAWLTAEPSGQLERAAQQWMSRQDLPAAVLLGASHLLPTAARPAALVRLKQLTSLGDSPVAPLALAQTWHTETASATPEQLQSWDRLIGQMPEPLRAGPYYTLGLAYAQHQQYEQAALAWMRLPILYPQHRLLAIRCLQDAGQALERLGRVGQAATLYRELVQTYPNSRPAVEARQRLEELNRR